MRRGYFKNTKNFTQEKNNYKGYSAHRIFCLCVFCFILNLSNTDKSRRNNDYTLFMNLDIYFEQEMIINYIHLVNRRKNKIKKNIYPSNPRIGRCQIPQFE